MTFNPLVSIIVVDYKKNNPYLVECLDAIQKQTYTNFEIILITDYSNDLNYPRLKKRSYGHYVGPAEKRDDGFKLAKGDILAFIDDDAYPSSHWLKKMVRHFANKSVAGVGGPGITPPKVSWQEEASGWASASPVGAGPYTYRFLSEKKRFVDDYPSMNLAVRKIDFGKVGGYDSNFWPGEDTKLCLDLTHKLNKKIIYDPEALVYHHRRPIFRPHLKQNGNFGLHRGFFARILPKTSLRPIYFLPSLLFLGFLYIISASLLSFLARPGIYTDSPIIYSVNTIGYYLFSLYFLALLFNALWIYRVIVRNESDLPAGRQVRQSISIHPLFQAFLSIPVIFVTHLWYGTRFLQGFFFTFKLNR